jgi:hypothetical protein
MRPADLPALTGHSYSTHDPLIYKCLVETALTLLLAIVPRAGQKVLELRGRKALPWAVLVVFA